MGFRKDNNMESVTPELKKEPQKIDRVVLDKESVLAIQNVMMQIIIKFGDMIFLLAGFLLIRNYVKEF